MPSPPPPSTPSSSTPNSLTNPPLQLCITPPSQRRRAARLARCAYVGARSGGSGAGAEGEAVGAGAEPERQGYAAEEIENRRQERRREEEGEWRGWEAEAEGYEGERFVGGLAGEGAGVEMDEGEGWEAAPEVLGGLGLPLMGLGAEPGFRGGAAAAGGQHRAWLNSLDTPITALPIFDRDWTTIALPSLGAGSGVDFSALGSGQTIPLVLGALYLLARAWGVGSSGGRRRGVGEVQGKITEVGRRI